MSNILNTLSVRVLKLLKRNNTSFRQLREVQAITPAEKKKKAHYRLVDKAMYEVLFSYYRNHADYEAYTDEDIEKLIDTSKTNLFIGDSALHKQYIDRINGVWKKDYIISLEDFQERFSLQDFINLQIVYEAKSISEIPEELRKNSRELKTKYLLAKQNFFVPLKEKVTQKTFLGILKPTTAITQFRFEDIVFLSPEIISDLFSVRGLDFLEGNMEDNERTPNENLNLMLQFMVDKSFSDLHFYLYDLTNYCIAARKNGEIMLLTSRMPISTADKLIEASLSKMGEDRRTTKTIVSKKIALNTNVGMRTFRVEMTRQSKTGVLGNKLYRSVDIRLLSDISFIKNIKNLRLGQQATSVLQQSMNIVGGGLFLFAGETNSGKTTTMYALLYYLHSMYVSKGKMNKVITIDKVLEYSVDGFVQYDITDTEDTKDPLTFDRAVESGLRQDPDIISIGEARSAIQLQQVIDAGNRGSPVFASLHSSSAEEVINLFENTAKIERRYFAANIRLIMHMKLETALCQKCFGEGCQYCGHTGESGKIPIFDLVYIPSREKGEGFNALEDDIYDFEGLEKQGKLFRITKAQTAQELYKKRFISKESLDYYTGVNRRKIIETFTVDTVDGEQ